MARVAGAKNRRAAAAREQETLAAVAGLTLETANSALATAQLEVQKALAEVSSQVASRLQVLRTVEAAIQLKEEQLKEVYEIEQAATQLDELTAQILQQRKAWEEEQVVKEREFRERVAERDRQWVREEEEYQYKLAQEHKKVQDAFAERMAQQEKENQARQETLERNWTERETALKKGEAELAELRQRVAGIPELVRQEATAAAVAAAAKVKAEYEARLTQAAHEAESVKKQAAQEQAALQQTVATLTTQVEELKAQLEQARRDVREVAVRALDHVGGRPERSDNRTS